MHLLWYGKKVKKNFFFYIFVTFPDTYISFYCFVNFSWELKIHYINNLIWATHPLQHYYLKIDFRVIIQVSGSRNWILF